MAIQAWKLTGQGAGWVAIKPSNQPTKVFGPLSPEQADQLMTFVGQLQLGTTPTTAFLQAFGEPGPSDERSKTPIN